MTISIVLGRQPRLEVKVPFIWLELWFLLSMLYIIHDVLVVVVIYCCVLHPFEGAVAAAAVASKLFARHPRIVPSRLRREPNKMMANTVRCADRSMVAIGKCCRNQRTLYLWKERKIGDRVI